jgi:hypothetical protein
MASKFIAIFALVAAASAQHYQNDYYHQQPQYQQYSHEAPALIKSVQPALIKSYQPAVVKQLVQPTLVKQVVHEAPATYEFNYDVHDPHTGDIKQQHEVAKDGAISGQYSLIDADGYRRIVDYTADDHHGFNANVRREPVEGHKQVVKTIQPVQKIIAQPAIAIQKYAAPAPQYYSAPAPQYHQYQQAAPAHQYYSAPAQVKVVAQPAIAVQKYIAAPAPQYYSAPAPQYHQYQQAAPAHQYYSAPAQVVSKVVAPVVSKVAASGPAYTHVSFNGPSSNYHY